MITNSRTELQELVESPNESLAVEYKGWLDLMDGAEARADLARHIAALANYGGGHIVFGFTDDMQFAGANPFPKVSYDHDLIARIVRKYLEPPFQCDVRMITSSANNTHPVIIVPGHGAAPICAKSGGPIIDGKNRGITQGVYYTRKPGPESAPILTSLEWSPIIRRCAMHERSAILGAVDAALRGASTALVSDADALKLWHDAARQAFQREIVDQGERAELAERHFQFTYAIQRSDGQQLDPNQLAAILREVNGEVRDLVHTGLSMFYIYTRPEIAPIFVTDPESGQGDQDFLQCTLARRTDAEMWRLSIDGKATLIREYWEDNVDDNVRLGSTPGSWFSPNITTRALAEFVRHARGLTERFDAPVAVSFRCEWLGLDKRQVFDPHGRWVGLGSGRGDRRVSTGTWPVGALSSDWPEIVAALLAPLARLFGLGDTLTARWVLGQAGTWLR
ncbi:MAG: AlbA family DNA-binding domain-containing protein [Candidatus Binataceae bacterium]